MWLAPAAFTCLMLLPICSCGSADEGQASRDEPASPTQPVSGHLLVGDSPQSLLAWTQAAPAAREGLTGLVDGVVYGQKAFVRAVVTDFTAAGGDGSPVTGDLTLWGPDGGMLHTEQLRGTVDDLEPDAPGVLVLRPGLDIVFDPGDPVGAYRLEADLHRGRQHLSLSRTLRVESGGEFMAPPTPPSP